MSKPNDLVQGTLDLLILKTLAPQPMHGWAIAQRIKNLSNEVLQVQQGLALSGPSSPGAARLDPGRMGRK
jgi:hypothetical protein